MSQSCRHDGRWYRVKKATSRRQTWQNQVYSNLAWTQTTHWKGSLPENERPHNRQMLEDVLGERGGEGGSHEIASPNPNPLTVVVLMSGKLRMHLIRKRFVMQRLTLASCWQIQLIV